MIPPIGQRFTVGFKSVKYTFDAVIMRELGDGMYELKTFNRLDFDSTGRTYRKPDDIIEVETKWFDTELTGRVIKVHNDSQLTLI